MKYTFELPIGDWSGDGHSKCEYFTIESNLPMNDIFAAYFKARKELPKEVCPENICKDYEENEMTEKSFDALESAGFDTTKLSCYEDDGLYIDQYDMVAITLWFMQQGNKELEFNVVPDENRNIFNNWSVPEDMKEEEKLSFIGYGLFD